MSKGTGDKAMGTAKSSSGWSKGWTYCALAVSVCASGCAKTKAPNSPSPEDKLLFELGNALVAGNKDAVVGQFDLELRQRLLLWTRTLKPITDPVKQAEALKAAQPRIGEAAALKTEGEDAWKEVQDATWAQELADGKCASAAPAREDAGRVEVPKPKPEMGQDLGTWVYDLSNTVRWAPALRCNCPTQGSFWVQLAQRKKGAGADDPPLKIIKVLK